MRGVAGAKMHVGKEVSEKGASRHRLSQNPQGSLRT